MRIARQVENKTCEEGELVMDSKRKKYGNGVVVALITPLKKNRQVDGKSLERIVSHCIAGGVQGIFVLGTTGEGTCFTQKEREKVISTVKSLTGETVPLYVGVMDSSANKVKQNIKWAENNGADIVVVTPHFYLSSKVQDEIVKHIEICATYASVPAMAYNIPQTTNVNITPEIAEKLMSLDNVMGLKDSSGNWEQFQKEIFLKGKSSFKLLMGAEDLAGIAMLMGADGCVTGIGNYEPGLIVRMYEEANQGNVEKVKQLQHKATRLRMACFAGDFWLAGLKYACSVVGLCEEYVSLPFQSLTDSQKAKVRNILREEGVLSGK